MASPIGMQDGRAEAASKTSNATAPVTLETSVDAVCRICLRACAPCGAKELLAPCSCKGSVGLVHVPCLQSWVQAVARRGGDATRCELCREAYRDVPGIPQLTAQGARRWAHLLPAALAWVLLCLSPPAMRPLVLATASVSWWFCGFRDHALLCATAIGALSLLDYKGQIFGAIGGVQVPSLTPGVALCFRANDGHRNDRNPFAYSVVLITDYSPMGAVGYIVNKPLTSGRRASKAGLGDLASVPQLRKGYGGPVPIGWSDGWEVLHTSSSVPGAVPSGLAEVSVGGSRDRLAQLALSEPKLQLNVTESAGLGFQALAVQGYAGWAPFQLDSEIRRNAWTVHDVTAALIFGTPSNRLWSVVCSLPDRTWNETDIADSPV